VDESVNRKSKREREKEKEMEMEKKEAGLNGSGETMDGSLSRKPHSTSQRNPTSSSPSSSPSKGFDLSSEFERLVVSNLIRNEDLENIRVPRPHEIALRTREMRREKEKHKEKKQTDQQQPQQQQQQRQGDK